MGRPLLVLDLDETIWHGVLEADAPEGVRFLLRPHLRAFLETVRVHYDLAVWTAAGEDWMQAGLAVVRLETSFDLGKQAVFLWHRSRCTPRRRPDGEYEFVKHARKFRAKWLRDRYPRERILVLDDQPSNYASGYGHLIKVRSWTGEQDDRELEALAAYLVSVAGEPDLCRLEKRGWRSRWALRNPG